MVNWAHDMLLKYISSLPQMRLHLRYLSARDFRLPPLCILGVRSSRMLHRITYQKREDLNYRYFDVKFFIACVRMPAFLFAVFVCLFVHPDLNAEVDRASWKNLASIPSWFPYNAYKIGQLSRVNKYVSCSHNPLFVCAVQEGRHACIGAGPFQGGAHHLSGMQCAG